jgi:polyhydroxyalkanoate synthesis regulator phasin
MKKKFTPAVVAASLVGGIAIGSFVAPPMAAFAADTSTAEAAETTARSPGQWITDSLKGLVDKGTITQEQSDAVATALEESKPQGPFGKGGHPGGNLKFHIAAEEVAEILGLSVDELRTQQETKSLADIAKEKNVDVQKVIDALVAKSNERIDQSVTDGRMTQEEANEKKAKVKERITEMVNTVRPAPPERPERPIGSVDRVAAAA